MSLWSRTLQTTPISRCRDKTKRARLLRRLGYTPKADPKRASQIRRAFVAFVLKHYGACYFVNRLESHLRDLFAKLRDSNERVIILIEDIQLAEEAYWARVHAPLVAKNEPTILIGVSAGKRRRQARAPEVYQDQISIAELESQPDTIECDFVVNNNGTLAELRQEVAIAVSFINRRTRIAS